MFLDQYLTLAFESEPRSSFLLRSDMFNALSSKLQMNEEQRQADHHHHALNTHAHKIFFHLIDPLPRGTGKALVVKALF